MIPENFDLTKYIEEIKNHSNLVRKKNLLPLMDEIKKRSFMSEEVFKGIGEDSAAIYFDENSHQNNEDEIEKKDKKDYKDKNLILLTTDAISQSFVDISPKYAGFSAIMVGAEDIYACGGKPIAASCVVSSINEKIRDKIFDGLFEASHLFKIPIVRGHTADDSKSSAISATIIGKIRKSHYISAGGACIGDKILIISDFDGEIGKSNKLYWNTVTFKTSSQILDKREIMPQIASEHLINASKDISNGGIFGTLLLMVYYSKVGAKINIESLKIPPKLLKINYNITDFSKMYLTTAFIVTCKPECYNKIKTLSNDHNMVTFEIGEITNTKQIQICYKNQSKILIDYSI